MTLEKTGVLHRPSEGKEMQTLLVREIKASGELPKELLDAWRTKGLEPDPSSTYEPSLFCSHAYTRRNMMRFAREEVLREGEIDLMADETMWKRGFSPVRMRPAKCPHEFRSRDFLRPVPFTASEIAGFLATGPCSELRAAGDSIVSLKYLTYGKFEIWDVRRVCVFGTDSIEILRGLVDHVYVATSINY